MMGRSEQAFIASVAHLADGEAPRSTHAPWRRDQHRGQKRGDGIGYSGHKHQKGEKVIAITDTHGYVLAPLPVAPVNETDMVLLPKGLQALKKSGQTGWVGPERRLSQPRWRL